MLAKSKTKNICYTFFVWWPWGLFSAFHKAKLFTKNFSKNCNLNDSGISLLSSPSWTNLKLHNILVTSKLDRKVITRLDLWKTSGPYCILVVVLKNFEPELSCLLAKLLNMCWKSLVFPIVGRSLWWSLYLGILGKGMLLKTATLLVFFLGLVKSLKNL